MTILSRLLGIVLVFWTTTAFADSTECPRPKGTATADMPAPATMPSMKMDAPMPSAMARPGTEMMDVTRQAAAKEACMQPMLKHEEQMMKKSGSVTPTPPDQR